MTSFPWTKNPQHWTASQFREFFDCRIVPGENCYGRIHLEHDKPASEVLDRLNTKRSNFTFALCPIQKATITSTVFLVGTNWFMNTENLEQAIREIPGMMNVKLKLRKQPIRTSWKPMAKNKRVLAVHMYTSEGDGYFVTNALKAAYGEQKNVLLGRGIIAIEDPTALQLNGSRGQKACRKFARLAKSTQRQHLASICSLRRSFQENKLRWLMKQKTGPENNTFVFLNVQKHPRSNQWVLVFHKENKTLARKLADQQQLVRPVSHQLQPIPEEANNTECADASQSASAVSFSTPSSRQHQPHDAAPQVSSRRASWLRREPRKGRPISKWYRTSTTSFGIRWIDAIQDKTWMTSWDLVDQTRLWDATTPTPTNFDNNDKMDHLHR